MRSRNLFLIPIFLLSFKVNAQLHTLCGIWYSNEYLCNNPTHYELFYINQLGDSVVCAKIIGDDCVMGGSVSWEGNYTAQQFNVILYSGSPGDPNSGSSVYPLLVMDSMHLLVATYINMYKYTSLQLDSLNINPSDYGLDCSRPDGMELIATSQSLSILANPFNTSTIITLINYTSPFNVQLFDELGREVPLQYHTTQRGNHTTLTIDRGELLRGMYFLTVDSGEKREVVKVMVE